MKYHYIVFVYCYISVKVKEVNTSSNIRVDVMGRILFCLDWIRWHFLLSDFKTVGNSSSSRRQTVTLNVFPARNIDVNSHLLFLNSNLFHWPWDQCYLCVCFQTYKYQSQLTCRYVSNGHPLLILTPAKEETMYLDPWVVLYHDCITEKEITLIKQLAFPKVSTW